MSPKRRDETAAEDTPSRESAEEEPRTPAPRPYLRTVYPLNPGIPHFIDFPEGWS